MKSPKKIIHFVIGCLISTSLFANDTPNLRIVEVANPDQPFENFLIIESDDSHLLSALDKLLVDHPTAIRLEHPVEEEFRSLRMITKRNDFIEKRHMVRDCLLGVGLCGLGVAYVNATGEDANTNPPPQNSMYAYVGSKYVTGSGACMACGLWVTGIVFGIKGIIEIFAKEKNGGDYSHLNHTWKAEDIIEQTTLVKVDEKSFRVDNEVMLGRLVLPYIMIKTWE